jgi:hypothetical protein
MHEKVTGTSSRVTYEQWLLSTSYLPALPATT